MGRIYMVLEGSVWFECFLFWFEFHGFTEGAVLCLPMLNETDSCSLDIPNLARLQPEF